MANQEENRMLNNAVSAVIPFLKELKTQVGNHYGERIDEHIAMLEGRNFINIQDMGLIDRNGEQ